MLLEHGIGQILTFNVNDFTRYSEILAVSRQSLIDAPSEGYQAAAYASLPFGCCHPTLRNFRQEGRPPLFAGAPERHSRRRSRER